MPRRTPLLPAVDRRELAAIFAGGFAGALVRAALSQSVAHQPGRWPWVTFGVNVAGAFVLGSVVTRLQERLPLSRYRRPLLGTGFCGALTTFSTMQIELLRMIDADHWALAAGYASASLSAGFAAVFLSTQLVRRARIAA